MFSKKKKKRYHCSSRLKGLKVYLGLKYECFPHPFSLVKNCNINIDITTYV